MVYYIGKWKGSAAILAAESHHGKYVTEKKVHIYKGLIILIKKRPINGKVKIGDILATKNNPWYYYIVIAVNNYDVSVKAFYKINSKTFVKDDDVQNVLLSVFNEKVSFSIKAV